MRVMLTLVQVVIAWTILVLIMPATALVWLITVQVTLQLLAPAPLFLKIIAVKIVKNAVMTLVKPAQSLTPVVLPAEPNAVQPVITVTLLAPPAPVHLIPEHLLEPTNADRPVRNVIMLVLRDIQHLQQLNAMIPPQTNAALLVIKKKTAILVPVIMNAAEHGNIVKVLLVRLIVRVAAPIAKATTFRTLAEATMVHVTEIIEAVIAPCLVIR